MVARFILGGVALAATGYGLKKYVDANDQHDLVEDVGSKILDWMDDTEEKVTGFFDELIEKLDDNPKEKTILEKLYICKDKFYQETVLEFLDFFGRIKGLPDFEMEQFYKLQKKYDVDSIDYNSLKVKTQESIKTYYEVFVSAKDIVEEHLNNVYIKSDDSPDNVTFINDDTEYDFSIFTQEQKNLVENLYLIVVSMIKISYIEIMDDNKKFSEKLNKEILLLKKLLKSNYSSLKKSQSLTPNI